MAFTGKVALITGGTKGIGRSVANLFVAGGAKVVLGYGSDARSADETVAALGGPETCLAVQADAGSLSGISHLVDSAVAHFNHIDFVVANAGWLPTKTVDTVTEADFERAFALNVKGPLFLVQQCLPHMPSSGGGRVVMMSTTQNTASTVTAAYTLYNATKGAVDQLVRCMAKDLGHRRQINVNAVAPGPTGTDLFYQGKSDDLIRSIAALNPYGRLGRPEEVAAAVVWLCAEGSSWINGQTVRVNGGMA